MPPKRKKSVRQKQKQRQSQSQKVIVNVGKTTPRKRKTSGRGRLPPPSYQQNLFPPTIIQQQAPNIAVLENQISRLTSLIQPTQPIQNLNTPLSNTQAQQMAGQKAQERRDGPTAGNFQPMPSKADFDLPDPLTGGPSDVSTLSGPSLPAGFNEDESLQDDDEQAEAFKQQMLKQKKEKEFGGSSLPPSNTIKRDDTGVKKSPPQSKLAEELGGDFTKMNKYYDKLRAQLPNKSYVVGSHSFRKEYYDKAMKGLSAEKFKQFLDENTKLLKERKRRKKASASSDEESELVVSD